MRARLIARVLGARVVGARVVGATVLGATALVAISLVAMLLGLLAVPAQAAPNTGQRIAVSGCAFAGTPATCLIVRGQDGTLYNISSVNPRPRALDRVIRVRGTVTDKVSICNQGIVLDRIRWSRTRQRCPN